MPAEIQVAPPGITISQGRTFCVTDERGEIRPETEEGIFAIDTRFISYYQLLINRQPWKLVTSGPLSFYASRIHLTNPTIFTEDGEIPENSLSLTVDRQVEEGIHEDFYLANYSKKPIRVLLGIELRSDFADIFEVKSRRFVIRGSTRSTWNQDERTLRTSYDYKDFHRAVSYSVSEGQSPVGYANGRVYYDVELQPSQEWHSCGEFILEHGPYVRKPSGHRTECFTPTFASGAAPSPEEDPSSDFDERQARWLARCTTIETPNEHVFRMHSKAVEDMGALRIYDMDVSDEAWVPAAGVPWFVTLFGRDSLIVSLQNMTVAPGFARGALKRLSEYQATQRDDWRDAQPGKILHEIRFGELAHFNKIPFTPYYGTADATILYLTVLSETYRWTGDAQLLRDYREVADACLKWIDAYGDLDGDGFQEYKTYSTLGYENLAWKDSFDAVVYADGTLVPQPKGLCELQGYVYDAKVRMAEVFEALGEPERAQQMRDEAQTLKRKFNDAFWMEDEGCFAYGLDPSKQQITSVASNVGHCLWSGIADSDKAKRTAARLLEGDMWSGWGIRTISRNNPAYNPLSYHLGSIWPHDNGIIAAGFKRYGLDREANYVIRGIFDAARRFDLYRLPEVFAGLQRRGKRTDFPVLYPAGANIPQAWASGSIFHMLQTIFGLRADVPTGRLYVRPTLPDWLKDIYVHHLHVGAYALNLHFWREGDRSRWEVLKQAQDEHWAYPAMPPIQVLDEPAETAQS
ncbi:MAG: amylo-alpha-1,6-glucosidase [Ktedonobacterales bacterium]